MTKCLTITGPRASYEIHMLNKGEVFPGFGGSSKGLIAIKTASMVLRQNLENGGMRTDIEFDIHDSNAWAMLAKMINATDGVFTAVAEPTQEKKTKAA